MLAEIGTFHQTKANDIKVAHQKFLQEQIAFYQKVKLISTVCTIKIACHNGNTVPCLSGILPWLWWFGFRLEPILGDDQANPKNVAHLKNDQN